MPQGQPWTFLDRYRGQDFFGQWPTIPELFYLTARRFPRRPCFTLPEANNRIDLDYEQALKKIVAIASALTSYGVSSGDKVALTGKNSPEWALSYLAILWAGAIVVPLDHQLKKEDALKLVRSGDVCAVFADEEKYDFFSKAQLWKALFSISPQAANYVLDCPEGSAIHRPSVLREGDIAVILFTSGTTGNPKGVMLSHANLVSDCFLAQGLMSVYPEDVFYALLPLHHSYSMLAVFIEAISVGAQIVFAKKMAVSSIVRDLKEEKITMLLGVPLLFHKLLQGILSAIEKLGPFVSIPVRALMAISGAVKRTTGFNPGKTIFRGVLRKAGLESVRICISGGGPLAPSIFRKFNQLGINFVQGYGLTETSPILTLNPVDRYKETSVGKVLPHVEMEIVDPDETGQGEIAVRGPMVMRGYYKDTEATSRMITGDGWLLTGDVGRLDAENYLSITGRKKSLIVTAGGKNVYPEEIEFAFQTYDLIEQILVRGAKSRDEETGEEVEALVYPNADVLAEKEKALARSLVPSEVRGFVQTIVDEVNQTLLPYQRIVNVVLLETPLEMTSTRKIKRIAADENSPLAPSMT